jgi:hypothetical protein
LLYARKLQVQVAPTESPGPRRSITRLEGGDLPEFFFSPRAEYLLEEPRQRRVRSALQAEISSPTLRGRTPEARILFQQDLWNRFDALHALGAKDSRAIPLARLVARLMAGVALTNDDLKGLQIGLAEVAQEQLDLIVEPRLFEADSGWRELVSSFDPGTDSDPQTTMHARRAGWRLVFRRFLRVPPEAGGVGCLKEHVMTNQPAADGPAHSQNGPCATAALPSGTTALLLETALALSAEGDLHAVPLLLAAEVRVARPGGAFTIVHAPRLALAASPRRVSLETLGEEDLIPQLGSVFPRSSGHPLVRMRQSCVLCHGSEGGLLGTNSFVIRPRTEVLNPANTIEQDRVLRAKRESESFQALVKWFRDA